MVAAVDDAVAAELPVSGALVKVTAVAEAHFPGVILLIDGLVGPVPDEAALVARLTFAELGIFVQRAAGVAHGVAVLAADEGFAPVVAEPLLDFCHGRVHAAFHVAGVGEAAVPEDALIVDKTVLVQSAEALAHVEDHMPAERFVAAGPDEHRGVVLVTLVDGFNTVQKQRLKLPVIFGDDVWIIFSLITGQHPGAVGLHVGLVDQIQAVAVAEGIEGGVIGIVTGADGVDVVALHGDDVALELRAVGHAPGAGVEVVAVDALENDAFAV